MNEIKKNREKHEAREREAYALARSIYLRMSNWLKIHYMPFLDAIFISFGDTVTNKRLK